MDYIAMYVLVVIALPLLACEIVCRILDIISRVLEAIEGVRQ